MGTARAGLSVPWCVVSTPGGENSNQRGQPSAQHTGTTAALDDLARRLAEAARGLQKQPDPQQVLDRVVSLAVAMVTGADEATITMVRARRHVYSVALAPGGRRHGVKMIGGAARRRRHTLGTGGRYSVWRRARLDGLRTVA